MAAEKKPKVTDELRNGNPTASGQSVRQGKSAGQKIDSQQLKGHLETLVLSLLSAEPMHGYGIMKSLSDRSGQVFEPGQGTVYPILYTMVEKGLVRSRLCLVDGRQRRLYSLSRLGRARLKTRTREWQTFQVAMNQVLGFT